MRSSTRSYDVVEKEYGLFLTPSSPWEKEGSLLTDSTGAVSKVAALAVVAVVIVVECAGVCDETLLLQLLLLVDVGAVFEP